MNLSSPRSVIFDRGIPDMIAYARCFDLDATSYRDESKSYSYNQNVFILAPWKEIYTTDEERKMSYDQTHEFHNFICEAYLSLGYKLRVVPQDTIQKRAQFVKDIVL